MQSVSTDPAFADPTPVSVIRRNTVKTDVLRNPSDHAQEIGIQLQNAFELPAHAAQVYHAESPWKDDAGHRALVLQANEAHVFHLAPFEVLTLDILPGEAPH